MKKEMFNLLVERILAQPDLFSTHKITKKEGLEVHTFGHVNNTDLTEAKALFKEKGYKREDVGAQGMTLNYIGKLTNEYLTILYGEDKDKISISKFTVGYALSYKTSRYYPVKRSMPVMAYTKHMYSFKKFKKNKPMPRIQLGNLYIMNFGQDLSDIATKTMLGIDYIPKANISYRHFINTKSDLEALGNMFGVKVPKALAMFNTQDLVYLYKTLKDYNQINKLCQFISKTPDVKGVDLYEAIAWMLFGEEHDYAWLVRDTMMDCITLKKREISFAITSHKRWENQHNGYTKLRMLKGVPEITVEETYRNALEGLEYPYELIETKERLIAESVDQHHCVATNYADKINSGHCAIFSITYEGAQWTLEVRNHAIGEDIIFALVQFRGLRNELAPELIHKRVAEVLAQNKIKNPNLKWVADKTDLELTF